VPSVHQHSLQEWFSWFVSLREKADHLLSLLSTWQPLHPQKTHFIVFKVAFTREGLQGPVFPVTARQAASFRTVAVCWVPT
jgi:hypothetical protein